MIQKVTAVLVLAIAGSATGQAITGFSGGTSFANFYADTTGDVIGYRFTMGQDVIMTDVGIWIDSGVFGLPGVNSTHDWGVWDSSGAMVGSGTTALGGTDIGGWEYTSVSSVALSAGELYTIGAVFAFDDDDEYISSATGITTSSDVTWVNSVFPSAGSLGLTFPTEDSAASSGGRFGPNFLFRPVPAPASAVLLGLGGIAATRRRR